MLLERADATAEEAIIQLVGMQAQAPYAPYFGLWSRLRKFDTADLADALTGRRLVRIALMRSTVHLVTTADYRSLRPWAQPALDRELDTAFKTTLTGLDRAAVAASGRALLDAQHLTPKELVAALHERWPDRESHALATVVRNLVPLIQVPPRAVWGVGGTTRYAKAADWTGVEPAPPPTLIRSCCATSPPSARPRSKTSRLGLVLHDCARSWKVCVRGWWSSATSTGWNCSTSRTHPAPALTRPRPFVSCPSTTTCSPHTRTAPG